MELRAARFILKQRQQSDGGMKYLMGFLSGFFLTVIVFVSGVAVTIVFLSADPVPVRRLNTAASEPIANENVKVIDASHESPTLVSQSGPDSSGTATQDQSPSEVHEDKLNSEQAIDPTTTASTTPDPSHEPASELSETHVAWCSEQYRSYDPEDNHYNAYSGERRECDSPYSTEQETSTTSASAELSLDPEHVRSCFARYRSYRPEDNTYQPYGGGPRRQCE